MMQKLTAVVVVIGIFLLGIPAFSFAADNMQKQVDAIKDTLPKFAIPMREVGARFQNMYFAAKGGNWGLAYYMSKYMNGALNPAKLTKPDEYPMWKNFYEETCAPLNKAIFAQDFRAFEKEYTVVMNKCNECHSHLGYSFIKVVKMKAPADKGIAYTGKSKAEDVPK